MTTIYDIAKAAGVSPTTVSRVLNNYPDVSKKTKEKIQKTIKELEYIPNTSARSLSTKRSYLIGVLFSETLNLGVEHPFFAGVIEGFKNELATKGYDTMFIVNKLGDNEMGYLQHCKIRGVDGVCFFATKEDDRLEELLNSDIKSVTTDIIHPGIPRICSDNYEGSRLAMTYLLNKGHTKNACIMSQLNVLSSSERYEGVKKVYKEQGKTYDEKYLSLAMDFNIESGYQAIKELYARLEESEYPTAIYAASDTIAIGVINYLKDIGKKVPEDVEVIGFDDIDLAAQFSPSISTIAQDRLEIGRVAARTLLKQIEGNKDFEVVETIKVPVKLILRESTK